MREALSAVLSGRIATTLRCGAQRRIALVQCAVRQTRRAPRGCFGMYHSHKPSTVDEASNPPGVERRRPGRLARVSPDLIPLLRDSNVRSPNSEAAREQGMAPARGIVFCTLSSTLSNQAA